MSIAIVTCRAQLGLHAPLVQVEVSLGSGLPAFSIVGLPATVVKESRDRVRAALVNSNFEFPAGRITVNLSPADIPKRGGRFDPPIALGILLASEQIKLHPMQGHDPGEIEFYGELGLSGELKSVPGMLLAAAHAARAGHGIVVPQANAEEVRVLLVGAARGDGNGEASDGARPGEISLAHHGVLFLEELPLRGTCNCRVTNFRINSRSFCRFAADRTAVKTAIARNEER